jgi:hypothetical protein
MGLADAARYLMKKLDADGFFKKSTAKAEPPLQFLALALRKAEQHLAKKEKDKAPKPGKSASSSASAPRRRMGECKRQSCR